MATLKGAYTSLELAGLFRRPVKAIHRMAQRESWASRPRPGRGGGSEWLVSSMPETTRQQILERVLADEAPVEAPPAVCAPVPAATAAAPQLKGWQRDVRDARLAILHLVQSLAESAGGQLAAERLFASKAAKGELSQQVMDMVRVAHTRKNDSRAISAITLRVWRSTLRREGPDALAPKPTATGRAGYPEWLGSFLRIWRRPTKPSVSSAYEEISKDAELRLPSLRSVEREIRRLGVVTASRGRMGPRELRNLQAYVKRTFDDLEPGDVYSADGHKADIEVQHPEHGQACRPEIITVVDIATRRVVGWSAELFESSWLVADALRHAVEFAGTPAIFYVDNGCGFKNDFLTGPGLGMCTRLGITPQHSIPYRSQARGVIERLQATLWVRAAKRLPAYMGADMDKEAKQIVFKNSRKELAAKGVSKFLMPWDRFLTWAREQVDAYNARPHSSLPVINDPETGKKRHQSPDERWLELVAAGTVVVMPSAEEIADVFRPYVVRTAGRCLVKLFKKTYYSRELDIYHGRDVQVGYDIHDPSRVWIRDLDGRLVCTAELDGHAAPYFPKSVIEEAKERRAKQQLQRLERKESQVLAALGNSQAEPAAVAEPIPVALEEKREQLAREMEASRLAAAQPKRDPKQERFLRALSIEKRLEEGAAVDAEETRWLAGYRETSEYRSQRMIYQDFGLAAFGG